MVKDQETNCLCYNGDCPIICFAKVKLIGRLSFLFYSDMLQSDSDEAASV